MIAKKIRNIVIWLISVVSLILMVYSYFLPESINIAKGQDSRLKFILPLKASVHDSGSGDIQVLNANNSPVNENIHMDLSKTVFCGNETGKMDMTLSLFGVPIKNVSLNILSDESYIPVGKTVGIVINTDGVLVLGTGTVKDKAGNYCEPCKGILRSGDLIKSVNGRTVYTKEDLISAIKLNPDKTVLKIDSQDTEIEIIPVISQDNLPMLGLWVRDSTQGIGTVTYYKSSDLSFGALGHPVTDVDTGEIMEIRNGEIYCAKINGVVKGKKGSAGELSGVGMYNDKPIGSTVKNCEAGIYGKLNERGEELLKGDFMPIALKTQVKKGSAEILADVDGKGVKSYSIEIEGINSLSKNTSKGMIIKITDEELIKKTGGIVQGMSGSPIIQNGCLIGAVTHVFIQNPQKGYGIFIENMLAENS